MAARKPDRRIEKTKRALGESFFSLMIEKGYEETSVADIAERANVGRSTFYAHYADKEDLLQDGLRGLKEHLLESAEALELGPARRHPALSFSLPMLEHVFEVRDLFRALARKRTGAPVQRELHTMLSDLVRERLEASKTKLCAPPELVSEFVVGAFLAVCQWWMAGNDEIPAAEVDLAFSSLALPALTGSLETKRSTPAARL